MVVPHNCIKMCNASCRKEKFDRTDFNSAFRIFNRKIIWISFKDYTSNLEHNIILTLDSLSFIHITFFACFLFGFCIYFMLGWLVSLDYDGSKRSLKQLMYIQVHKLRFAEVSGTGPISVVLGFIGLPLLSLIPHLFHSQEHSSFSFLLPQTPLQCFLRV